MDQTKIQIYKKQLARQREKILAEIEADKQTADFGDDIDHFDEETDEAEETSIRLSIVGTLKVRLNEIDTALNDIISGNYGACKSCGNEIEVEVLDVAPESQCCSSCKKKQNRASHI